MKTETKIEITNCCEDFEWDDYLEDVSCLLKAKNENLVFYIEGRNMGWMNREGYMCKAFEDAQDFLFKVFPNTQWNATFYTEGEKLLITLYHHDSPTGEHYEVFKADKCAVCGEPERMEKLKEDAEGWLCCDYCRKDGAK